MARGSDADQIQFADPGRSSARRLTWPAWVAVVMFFFIRAYYASTRQLVADEAVYWSWSRHLSTGYLDHPPMVAYLIGLSTAMLGTSELGVRFFAVLLATLILLMLLKTTQLITQDSRAVLWSIILWLSSPLLAGFGLLMTPDTPVVFFSLAALMCVVIALRTDAVASRRICWIGFGICCGLALTSKYTAVVLVASIGIALLTTGNGRRELRTIWPWMSLLIAAAIFWPVVYWNQTHHWASFAFQVNHGLSGDPRKAKHTSPFVLLSLFVLNESLVWTPVLFILSVIVLVHYWKRYAAINDIDRLLLWASTFPLIFFAFAASRAKSEANWPTFAYFPLGLLIIRWLADGWGNFQLACVRNSCIVAAVGLVVLHVPEKIGLMAPAKYRQKIMAKLDELTGWRELGAQVEPLAGSRLIVCEKHQDAAELAFYLPGRPDVWPVGDGRGRPFAFDYFDLKPEWAKAPAVLFVGYHYQAFAAKYGLVIGRKADGSQNNVDLVVDVNNGGQRHMMLIFLVRPAAAPRTTQ